MRSQYSRLSPSEWPVIAAFPPRASFIPPLRHKFLSWQNLASKARELHEKSLGMKAASFHSFWKNVEKTFVQNSRLFHLYKAIFSKYPFHTVQIAYEQAIAQSVLKITLFCRKNAPLKNLLFFSKFSR